MTRLLQLLLFTLIFFGCGVPEKADIPGDVHASLMLQSANLEKEDIGMVSGLLFTVNDYNTWMSAYQNNSEGLIIALRNVDAPNLTVVFEGSKTMELAEQRISLLSSEDFLSKSTSVNTPMHFFYKIEYYDKDPNPTDHFVALSYDDGDNGEVDWIEFVTRNKEYFEELKIEPAGIGTNPDDENEAYILLRQQDFVSFRKLLNSPRKINKFLNKLNLPEQTLISYWIRISEVPK